MATIKSHTDIPQSKKLAEFLSLESADMVYTMTNGYNTPWIRREKINELDKEDVCAWSLAALLGVLPKINGLKPILDLEENSIQYTGIDLYVVADNPVDACYEIILKLNELKML